ncbi:hypothetical protein M3J09_007805 [Ascochyta lentis]
MPHLTTRLSNYLTRRTNTPTTNAPESRVKKHQISRPIILEREEEICLLAAASAAPIAVPVASAVAIAVPAQGNLDSGYAGTDSGMRSEDDDLEWARELDGYRCSDEELYTDIDDILDIYRSRPDSRVQFQYQYQYQYRYNSHTGNTPPPPPPKHVRVDTESPESVYPAISTSSSRCSLKSAYGATTTSTSASTTAISATVQRFENTPPPAPSYAKLSFGEVWGVGAGRWGGLSAVRGQEMRGGGARGGRGL